MSTPLQLLALAFAGALGTLARYGLTVAIDSRLMHDGKHPLYGTLLSNALGCLLFGVVLAYLTAAVDADGTVHFYPDIYGKDAAALP